MLGVFLMMLGLVGLRERGVDMIEFRLKRVRGIETIRDAFVDAVDIDDDGVTPPNLSYVELQHREVSYNGGQATDWETVPIVDAVEPMDEVYNRIVDKQSAEGRMQGTSIEEMTIEEMTRELLFLARGRMMDKEAGHQCDRHGAIGQCSKCGKIPVSPTSP